MRNGVPVAFLALNLIFAGCGSIKRHVHATPSTNLIRIPGPVKNETVLVVEPTVFSVGKVHVQQDLFATPPVLKFPDGRPVPNVVQTGVMRISWGKNPLEEPKPPKSEPKLPGLIDRATGRPVESKAEPAAPELIQP